jgi:hypothetical protein
MFGDTPGSSCTTLGSGPGDPVKALIVDDERIAGRNCGACSWHIRQIEVCGEAKTGEGAPEITSVFVRLAEILIPQLSYPSCSTELCPGWLPR